MTPPASEMIVVSIRNWRIDVALLGADRAADADLARPLHHAGEHDVHDPDAADQQRDRGDRHHDHLEDALRAALLGEQLRRRDDREVAGVSRCATVSRPRSSAAAAGTSSLDSHLQVDAVDLVLVLRLAVFEAEDRRVQRHVDQVVAILRRDAGDVALHGQLRPGDADHLEPLIVDLDVAADRIVGAEQRRRRALRRAPRPAPPPRSRPRRRTGPTTTLRLAIGT